MDGIPAADSELRVNLARDGRVLNVLGAPAHDLDPTTTPALTAGEAVRAVQDDVGVYRPLPRDAGPSGATRATTYADGTTAALALYTGRLAWRVTYRAASDAVYDVLVDAAQREACCGGRTWSSPTRRRRCGRTIPGDRRRDGRVDGRPRAPWLSRARRTLLGPNVHAYSDVNDDDVAQTRRGGRAGRATRSTPFSGRRRLHAGEAVLLGRRHGSSCAGQPRAEHGAGLLLRQPLPRPPRGRADRLHRPQLRGRATGWSSRRSTAANRACRRHHVNNANMFTPPDGTSPVMQMYLWRARATATINGGDDASILYHEYTHGLSNRLVRDADGAGALNSPQAGAMGEGWSDWYAKDFLVAQFPELDTGAAGEIAHGRLHGRRAELDCARRRSTARSARRRRLPGHGHGRRGRLHLRRLRASIDAARRGPLRRRDLGADAVGPADRGRLRARRARLVTAGMRLSPPEPSFLDMRNAILLADEATGAGRRPRCGRSSPRAGWASSRPRPAARTRPRSRTSRCRPAGDAARDDHRPGDGRRDAARRWRARRSRWARSRR